MRIEGDRNGDRFVLLKGHYARLLPVEVNRVPRIDLQAFRRGARDLRQLRPNAGERIQRHVWQRKQVEAGTAAAIPIERDAVFCSLVRCQRKAREMLRQVASADDFAAKAALRSALMHPRRCPAGVSRSSALSARSRRRYSARLVNIGKAQDAARHEIVDHHADIGVGAGNHEIRYAAACLQRRVYACHEPLPASFLIAGRAIDLPCEIQTGQPLDL